MTPNEQPTVDATLVDEEPSTTAVRDEPHQSAWTRHRLILLLAVGVLAGSAILGPDGNGRLKLPSASFSLPGICTFKNLTGLNCPSCGLTRCFVWMSRGNVARACDYNPVGVAFFLVVVAQVPYRAWQLARLARGRPEFKYPVPWLLPTVLLVAIFVQWLFGIAATILSIIPARPG